MNKKASKKVESRVVYDGRSFVIWEHIDRERGHIWFARVDYKQVDNGLYDVNDKSEPIPMKASEVIALVKKQSEE